MRGSLNKRLLIFLVSFCSLHGVWGALPPAGDLLNRRPYAAAYHPDVFTLPPIGCHTLSGPSIIQGFGIGPSMSTLFSSNVDQVFFPGFNVSSLWIGPEYLVELRGRFFFGEVDAYSIEAAGYRPMSTNHPALYMGGGIGYGGMNLKEMLVFDINGQPLPGIFFHNGRGLHTFLGIGAWISKQAFYQVRAELDYFLALYHVDKISIPSGIRLNLTIALHAPEQ
jgi:hypothetical protein